jgi:hypothetical protein
MAPPTPPPLLSRQHVVYLSQSSYVSPVELADVERGGARGGAKSYDIEKAWSLQIIQNSLNITFRMYQRL